jgi:hypothetical protein
MDASEQKEPADEGRLERRVGRLVPKRAGRPATTQLAVLSTFTLFRTPLNVVLIAEMTGVSRYVVWSALYRLQDAGKVERRGDDWMLRAPSVPAAQATWMTGL